MNRPQATPSLFLLATLGVVYGDIGTSPLYAMKTCFQLYGLDINPVNVLGVLSLIFWSLFFVVSVKYIHIILKANNHGEGGILSLLTLCSRLGPPRIRHIVTFLGILGTALFYGDGVITPAISVLGALEGLSVISGDYANDILPLAILILIALFMLQKKGSQMIGGMFGPIMFIWFAALAVLGIYQITQTPQILMALNPYHAIQFLMANEFAALLTFGGIVLVVTGAEALYADLGHFNLQSIRITWTYCVFPSLALNYFGQGALLLQNPNAIDNPFYMMAPQFPWALYPLVILATLATIIASQAIISGIFSISWQAIQLDYLPRMKVIHTSAHKIGQVYLPTINYFLLFATVVAVLIFQDTNSLASAYGVSITWIMMITSTLAVIYALYHNHWSLSKTMLIFTPFLILDFLFLTTSSVKIFTGGWFPLAIATIMYLIISSWKKGRKILLRERNMQEHDFLPYIRDIAKLHHERIPGTAIFLSRSINKVPSTFEIHLKHNKFLHERVIFLSIITHQKPKISEENRLKIIELDHNIYQIYANFGFVDVPVLSDVLNQVKMAGITFDLTDTSFLISKGLPVASAEKYLTGIQEKIFIILSHNAVNATEFFQLPDDQVVEYGVKFKV